MKNNYYDCVLLGGRGYIGKYLSKKLADRGESILCVGRDNDLYKAVRQGRIIYYLLGQKEPNFNTGSELDILKNILNSIDNKLTKQFIFFSSVLVYGNTSTPANENEPLIPEDEYSKFKIECEKVVNSAQFSSRGVNKVVIRLSNVYGRNGNKGFIGLLVKTAFQNKNHCITINGDGKQLRDYVFIDDVINGVLEISDNIRGDDIINLSSGKSYSLLEVVDVFNEIFSNNITTSVLYNNPVEVKTSLVSNYKLRNKYKYLPEIDLAKGLKITLNNYEKE